jgi:hypothetical protein
VVYGDKVIVLRNHRRDGRTEEDQEAGQLAKAFDRLHTVRGWNSSCTLNAQCPSTNVWYISSLQKLLTAPAPVVQGRAASTAVLTSKAVNGYQFKTGQRK